MRYTSSHPSTFRNRIAKSIGVLVAAALIATLGLPSAAQAQTIPNTSTAPGGIVFADTSGFTVNWTTRLADAHINNWIVTFTKPNGDKVVVNERSTNPMPTGLSDGTSTSMFNYNRNDEGTWWMQVDVCAVDLPESEVCPSASLEKGTAVGYTHGSFPAPKDLAASPILTGVALTWTSEKSDHGFVKYEYSMDADAAKPTWKNAGADGIQRIAADPGEYTFSVRALGESDNDKNTSEGALGAAESVGMVASTTIMVPTPTPTLPEIAALLLAMLLLGSGAYLLRRRQSGGLTAA